MKLYGSLTSPYVRHCRITLMQGNICFDLIATDQVQSAKLSPTKRVPFLRDGDLLLRDSSSIIRYAREKAGAVFLPKVEDLDKFCFINTILDSAANIFYLEKFGLDQNDNAYAMRQQQRIAASLDELEQSHQSYQAYQPLNDWHIRLACFIDWATFRHRIQIEHYPHLQNLVKQALQTEAFAQTQPTE
ncbi:MAG: glutathione S-transferase family protein [Sinobacterium sp.]|nr:glutathione S-transferase family protein [Sinobacterium sp.]